MRPITIVVGLLVVACSGSPPSGSRSESPNQNRSAGAGPAYELNEWGLISVSPSGFEVAAGPGQRIVAEISVDKPVLYVHAETDAPFTLSVRIDVSAGLEVVEHYPPAELTPLRWRARVSAHCAGSYPGVDDSRCPDGYCETAELPIYETPDAACLEVGATRAPLLFYRLRAPGQAPPMPLEVTRDGEALVVRNARLGDVVGSLWRVTFDGSRVGVTRADVPAIGASVRLARGGEPVAAARDQIRAGLIEHGLRESERDAFLRAWDNALFGYPMNDGDGTVDESDGPVDVLTNDRTTLAGPRLPDVLLYWLDAAAIDGLARITAEPAPREVHRAYLVRVASR